VEGFKEETKNNIIDLRSTLIINDILKSENVIVVEVSIPAIITYYPLVGTDLVLFDLFDKIKKLNGNLFHFGKCTNVAYNSKDNVVDLIWDSVIYVSIYLRVNLFLRGDVEEDVMFYLTKNHEEGLNSAILAAAVTPVPNEIQIQLVRLHGKLSIKASEDLTLNVFLSYHFSSSIMDKSIFTMYVA